MTDLSPLAAAEDAKRRRDIGGEIGAVIRAGAVVFGNPARHSAPVGES